MFLGYLKLLYGKKIYEYSVVWKPKFWLIILFKAGSILTTFTQLQTTKVVNLVTKTSQQVKTLFKS